MLETIIILLVVLWALGFWGPWHMAAGGLIHLLLVIAIVVLIYRLLVYRRTPPL